MHEDNFGIYDIERAILTGRIIERQEDVLTGEWKYRVEGESVQRMPLEVVAKLSPTSKLVIITVYAQ